MADLETVEIRSRADLHDWLAAHHRQADSVWLLFFKKHTEFYLPFGELVSELLCWGWVDSRSRGVDPDRSSVLVSPRNPASAWSAVNKEKVAALRDAGLMQPSGEAVIAAAMQNGAWEFLDDVERLEVPADLRAALSGCDAVWERYPRSIRRAALEWVKTAKRAETRSKRIADIAASAAAGHRPTPFRG